MESKMARLVKDVEFDTVDGRVSYKSGSLIVVDLNELVARAHDTYFVIKADEFTLALCQEADHFLQGFNACFDCQNAEQKT